MLVTTKRRVVEEEVTRFINVVKREKQMREKMKCEENRLNSFPTITYDTRRLAKAGFYYNLDGITECFSCGLLKALFFWEKGYDPEQVHRTRRPNCDFFKGGNVPIVRYNCSFTRKKVPATGKRLDSKPALGNVMMRKQNPQRKESNTEVKSQTENNTYSENQSPKGTKEGNTERKNDTFSLELQRSSVPTGEPDEILTTCKQQRPSSVPAESTTDRETPNRRAKVSVGKFPPIQTFELP